MSELELLCAALPGDFQFPVIYGSSKAKRSRTQRLRYFEKVSSYVLGSKYLVMYLVPGTDTLVSKYLVMYILSLVVSI